MSSASGGLPTTYTPSPLDLTGCPKIFKLNLSGLVDLLEQFRGIDQKEVI